MSDENLPEEKKDQVFIEPSTTAAGGSNPTPRTSDSGILHWPMSLSGSGLFS
jgi:hypothetical protein